MIFDKDIVWDRKPIAYSDNNIKMLDKVIVHTQIPKSKAKKMKDILFFKDVKVYKSLLMSRPQRNKFHLGS